MIQIGDYAPDLELPDSDGKIVTLKALKGRWVVLYFYPKDLTSGCTIEALDFTFEKAGFDAEGAVVLGVSADSRESHLKFREKNHLKHTLLRILRSRLLRRIAYGKLRSYTAESSKVSSEQPSSSIRRAS